MAGYSGTQGRRRTKSLNATWAVVNNRNLMGTGGMGKNSITKFTFLVNLTTIKNFFPKSLLL